MADVFPVDTVGNVNFPTGTDSYSGKVIPTLWAAKLLERFYDASVVPQISQTDYEGMIKQQGDTVHINTVPDMTTFQYKMGMQIPLQYPKANIIDLVIDQGVGWQFAIDDVLKKQSMINLQTTWSAAESETLKVQVDTAILSGIKGDADATNMGATAGRISGNIELGDPAGAALAVTPTTVETLILGLGQALDENNIPETGRKLVIPAWMNSMIKQSDYGKAYLTGDGVSPLRNGQVGTLDRFQVYVSNLLPTANDTAPAKSTYIYAIHPTALTFASQLVSTESIRSELYFATLLRGLMVYGYKLVQPKSFAVAFVKPGA